ncbi:MAG: NPXTG-anchored protein [Clostridia bacterium]|nr:NPXTG-anchored protein [Clostridia bacterium]
MRKKLLAMALSCLMLVCMLAIGGVSAAAEATAVGTATDPAESYEKEVAITNADVTLPEGTALGNGKAGAWITPYYGLIIPGDAADNYTFGAGAITIDLGEAFKAICLDVAENLPDKGNKKWDAIEVSVNGTDWFPLNATRIMSDTVVGAGAFNMRATTYSATVDAEAGYRYVRLTQNAACAWNFICPAIAAIKYDPAVESEPEDPAPPAVEGWEPDLSENATEMNFDMPYLTPFLGAPYSYGFSGAGNPNQDSAPSAARAQDVEYIGATHTWMVTTGYTGVTRLAFETNAAKDFTFTLRVYSKDVSSLANKIKVYACEGFTGGSYGGLSGDRAHEVDPATPTNPTRLAVTFEEAATQPLGPDWKNVCVVAAGDIPVNATNLYIELEGLGNGWEIGLIDFDYVSDPIVIVPLPDFGDAGDYEEMFEDFASPNRLTLENDGQALSITNLKHAAQKFGIFNDVDNMLVVQEAGNDGSIIYNYNGVKQIDVRGWVNDASKDNVPVVIEVSADGETWTEVQATARLSQAFNAYTTFSLLVEDVADGANFVKLTVKDGAEVSISDLQILYTNELASDDDNTGDDSTGDDNTGDDTNPDTGVVAPAAALIIATLSGAAAVISKRRR